MLRNMREQDCYTIVPSPDDIALAIRNTQPGRCVVETVSPAGELLSSGTPAAAEGQQSASPTDSSP